MRSYVFFFHDSLLRGPGWEYASRVSLACPTLVLQVQSTDECSRCTDNWVCEQAANHFRLNVVVG